MFISNFHSHTTWCDGKNSVKEMADEAARLGCAQFGFSGHSPLKGHNYTMRSEQTEKYFEEVNSLKEEYGGRIELFCGIEQDFLTPDPADRYDYIIGSVHLLDADGEELPVDSTAQRQEEDVKKHFDGDFYKYTDLYFDTMIKQAKSKTFDVVGHFDLVAKFNEQCRFFDETSPRYREKALEALYETAKKKVVFEINSGASSRGYREEYYPARFLLEEISRLGLPVVFSSDCHRKEHILFGFEKMSELAKEYKLTVIRDMHEILSFTRG